MAAEVAAVDSKATAMATVAAVALVGITKEVAVAAAAVVGRTRRSAAMLVAAIIAAVKAMVMATSASIGLNPTTRVWFTEAIIPGFNIR